MMIGCQFFLFIFINDDWRSHSWTLLRLNSGLFDLFFFLFIKLVVELCAAELSTFYFMKFLQSSV